MLPAAAGKLPLPSLTSSKTAVFGKDMFLLCFLKTAVFDQVCQNSGSLPAGYQQLPPGYRRLPAGYRRPPALYLPLPDACRAIGERPAEGRSLGGVSTP